MFADVRPLPKEETNLVIDKMKAFADSGNIDIHISQFGSEGQWTFTCNWNPNAYNLNQTRITGSIRSTQTKDAMDGTILGGHFEIYPDRSSIRFDGSFDDADDRHKHILHDIIKAHGGSGKNRLSYWFNESSINIATKVDEYFGFTTRDWIFLVTVCAIIGFLIGYISGS